MYTNLIPNVYKPHSQCIQTSFPMYTNLIPNVYKPHSQCIQTSFPISTNPIPNVYKPHFPYSANPFSLSQCDTKQVCDVELANTNQRSTYPDLLEAQPPPDHHFVCDGNSRPPDAIHTQRIQNWQTKPFQTLKHTLCSAVARKQYKENTSDHLSCSSGWQDNRKSFDVWRLRQYQVIHILGKFILCFPLCRVPKTWG